MNESTELACIIGNPTEAGVAETLWVLGHDEGREMAAPAVVAEDLIGYGEAGSSADAHDLINEELAAHRIHLLYGENLTGTPHQGQMMLVLDDIMRLQIRRRFLFWGEMHAHVNVPAHLPNEGVIVRGAVIDWQDTYGEAVGINDLVSHVQTLAGYGHEFWAIHAVLNAIDCQAIRTVPEYSASDLDWNTSPHHRCWLVDGWLQTLDS